MPGGLIEKTSTASGEISPELWARSDLARYSTGLKICENFVPMVEGVATRRPGTRFVAPVKDETKPAVLIDFEFSEDDQYMLVLNAGVMRVYLNGGIVVDGDSNPIEAAHPYADADLGKIGFAQQGDVIFLACDGYYPKTLTRVDALTWTFADYANVYGPVEAQNLDISKHIKASAQTGTITLLADFDIFQAGHVGSIWHLDEQDLSNVPLWVGNEDTLDENDLRRNNGSVYQVVSTGTGQHAGPNPPTQLSGDVSAGGGFVTWRYLYTGGAYVTITAVTDGENAAATVMGNPDGSAGMLSLDATTDAGTFRWSEGSWSSQGGYPKAVIAGDDRLVWARLNRAWLTQIGDFYDQTVDLTDTSAVAALLTSRDGKQVDIMWMADLDVLMLGTRSGEWAVTGANIGDPITPANIRAKPQTSEGAAPGRAYLVDIGVVFIGRSGRRLHFASFDGVSEKLVTDELSVYARHILQPGARAITWQRDPNRLVWVAMADGTLASLTFRPDQQSLGWARHPMANASVEAVATINSPDATTQQVWMVVSRTINGAARRYIEVMTDFFEPADSASPTAAGAWFVDCGLEYSGDPVIEVSGADHLVGETVRVFADGVMQNSKVVSADGKVQLDYKASIAVLGEPIVGRIRTLRQDTSTQQGATTGLRRASPRVFVDMVNSFGGAVGENEATHYEHLTPTGALPTGVPVALISGRIEATVLTDIENYTETELLCDNAYPFTLSGLSPDIEVLEG